jgi:hypothetical protein
MQQLLVQKLFTQEHNSQGYITSEEYRGLHGKESH